MMFYRLFQLLLLSEFCIINSSEWDFLFNLDDNDKLICYSCKGNECEQVTDNDRNKVICNKKTQLCWAGFVDQRPYRTCASRYCTPSDFSLDSDIRIETCCRSNLCNSVSLSWSILGKSYRKNPTSRRTQSSTTLQTTLTTTTKKTITSTTTISTAHYFIGEVVDEKLPVSNAKELYSSEDEDIEEHARLHGSQSNRSDSHSYGINWDRLTYDKHFNNGVASISSIVLFLIPLLFVLLI